MARIVMQVLEGLERGRVFSELVTPLTIGREDENDVQLNDERVSRFHVKLQDDSGRIILTDLDSTNGTRVNGHPVQMHVLRPGDLISVGRCLLVFGDVSAYKPYGDGADEPEEFSLLDEYEEPPTGLSDIPDGLSDNSEERDVELSGPAAIVNLDEAELFPGGPPELPRNLQGLPLAQLIDLLAYLHGEVGRVVNHTVEAPVDGAMRMTVTPWHEFHRLTQLQFQLAAYLRELSRPKH